MTFDRPLTAIVLLVAADGNDHLLQHLCHRTAAFLSHKSFSCMISIFISRFPLFFSNFLQDHSRINVMKMLFLVLGRSTEGSKVGFLEQIAFIVLSPLDCATQGTVMSLNTNCKPMLEGLKTRALFVEQRRKDCSYFR